MFVDWISVCGNLTLIYLFHILYIFLSYARAARSIENGILLSFIIQQSLDTQTLPLDGEGSRHASVQKGDKS